MPSGSLASFQPKSIYIQPKPIESKGLSRFLTHLAPDLVVDAPSTEYLCGWNPSTDSDFPTSGILDLSSCAVQIIRCRYEHSQPFVILAHGNWCEVLSTSDSRAQTASGPVYSGGHGTLPL